MTFNEWITQYLDEGLMMFPDDIAKVTERFKESPVNKSMQGRWGDETLGYPKQVLSALRLRLNTVALEYIRLEHPQHFIIGYLEEITREKV